MAPLWILALPFSFICALTVVVVVTLVRLPVLREDVHEGVPALPLRRQLAVESPQEVRVAVHGRVQVGNESGDLQRDDYVLTLRTSFMEGPQYFSPVCG